uniref:Uncharacterized protein n=1 Tax=Timema bartmani TaxID=61472 RepID=A0A7R9I922_9NEOP|nr:unnamed protein product [Timema bartmani]
MSQDCQMSTHCARSGVDHSGKQAGTGFLHDSSQKIMTSVMDIPHWKFEQSESLLCYSPKCDTIGDNCIGEYAIGMDSNPDLLLIGSPVYYECNALEHSTIERIMLSSEKENAEFYE